MSARLAFPKALALALEAFGRVQLGLSPDDALDAVLTGAQAPTHGRELVAELLDRFVARKD